MRTNSGTAQQRSMSSRRRESSSVPSSSSLKRKSRRSSKDTQQMKCTDSVESEEKLQEPPKKKRGRPRLKSNEKDQIITELKTPSMKKTSETEDEDNLLSNKNDPVKQEDNFDKNEVKMEKNISQGNIKEGEKNELAEESYNEKIAEDYKLNSTPVSRKAKDSQKNKKDNQRNLRITSGRRSRDALARQSALLKKSLVEANNEKSHSQKNDSLGCSSKTSEITETLNSENSEKNLNETSDSLNISSLLKDDLIESTDKDLLLDELKGEFKDDLKSLDRKNMKNEKIVDEKQPEIKKEISDMDVVNENQDNEERTNNTSILFERNVGVNKTEYNEVIKDSPENKLESKKGRRRNTSSNEEIPTENNLSEKSTLSFKELDNDEPVQSDNQEINENISDSKPELIHEMEANETECEKEKLKLDSSLCDDHLSNDESVVKSDAKTSPLDSSVCSPSSSTGTEAHNRMSSRLMKPRQRGPYRPGIDFKVGSRLEACDFMEKWYPSKIVGVDWKEHEVLIHFERWSSRFDEWVSMDSPRLRAITRTSARKEYRQKLQQEFKIGDNVLAKWVDGKMYPAKVVIVNNNGTCEVMFHDDGIQKLVKLAHVQKISKDDPMYQAQLPKNINLPVTEKKNKTLETRSRSESKEKKATKTAVRKDSPSIVDESSSNKTKGKNVEKIEKTPRTKQMLKSLKNEKSSSSYGFMMRRKKLLVGGIFQAKRTHIDAPSSKKSLFLKRRQQQDSHEEQEPAKKIIQLKKNSEPLEENEKLISVDNADTSSKDLVSQPSVSSEESTSTEESAKKRKPSGGTAPKEFIIEEDHNHFKCPIQECGKGFRKESLLASHMKHYHNKQSKKESTHIRRKNDSDKPTPKQQTENKVNEEISKKTDDTIGKIAKCKEPEPETSVVPVVSNNDKTTTKEVDNVPVRRGERQRKYPSIAKEISSRRRNQLFNKNSTREIKSTAVAFQSRTNEQPFNAKRKIIPKDKSGSITSTKDIKGNFGFDCTVKDGTRKRKLTSDSDKSIRVEDGIKEEPLSQKESSLDDAAASIEAVVKNETESPIGENVPSRIPHRVRKTGRKRHAGISSKIIKEESSSGEKPNSELAENNFFYEEDNDEEDARNEVVNCICRFKEEEGLMMQCENCMAWQHGTCFNIEEEEKVPERYICFACRNPKAQRRGYKYWYEQGWWKTGEMATFNFLPKEEPNSSFQNSVLKSHALISSIQAVNRVLHSLRHKLLIAGNPDHPQLKHWKQPWTDVNLSCETKPLSSYDQTNDNSHTQKGELLYTDHSYSAVNKNNTHAAMMMNARMPIVDMVNSEMDSFSLDLEDNKSEEPIIPSYDVLIQRSINDGDVSLSSHETENSLMSEPSVNIETGIKPDPENLMQHDKTNTSTNITESVLERKDAKNFMELTNEQSSNIFVESKRDILQNCSSKSSIDDPILCQLNVLDHIEQMQEEVDRRLEEIMHHVEALESEWEINHPNQKTLSGPLSVKKMLKILQNNLSKVQKMSLFT